MSRQMQLPRRTFLKGVGTAISLPLLETMRPIVSAYGADGVAGAASSGGHPVRMAFVFVPNGVIRPAWRPSTEGADFELSETLQPLESVKSHLNVLSGLAQRNGYDLGDGAGDHARSAASFLTGTHPYKTAGANIRAGISADQVAASMFGGQTVLPSLEIGIERGRHAGNCDSGYSCAYSNTISWRSPTTPMAKETNPRLVFERLFGQKGADPKEQQRRAFFRKSILDAVTDDAKQLKSSLGRTDRQKIDEYFVGIREIEQRIAKASQISGRQPNELTVPDETPSDFQEHVRLMYDLLVLAFQSDSTRIATFMLGNEGSNRAFTMIGVNEGHHTLSHHGEKPEMTSQLQKIDQYLIEQFGYFLQKMKSIQEGERSLLDNSMIVYGSGLGDGNSHEHHNLPILLAGRGAGTISSGRHIVVPENTPLNNLF
ncbi:MAG: DUF1552 domain-containing protein, partial [Planctomycetes bacterium]|nr:DUF1552 domain-containing protein [Planctomycetota bacterium]